MSDAKPLLDALAGGETDRTALADRLGVSGDVLSELIDDLRGAGFDIEEEDGTYRVVAVPEYGPGVQYELAVRDGAARGFEVEYHEEIGSTNDRGRELGAEGARDVVVLADRQTGGRGREGRAWSSPPGGIYTSIVVRPDLPPERAGLLTLAAAVAVVDAISAVGVEGAIKWPNDVQLAADGRKLSGILTESSTAGGGVEWAVVGIGINANVDAEHLPETATSLAEHVGPVERRVVVARLLETFAALREDPVAIVERWREHASTLGRRVRVETGDETVVGEAIDIDESGALLVETDEDLVRIAAGDCEHLRPV